MEQTADEVKHLRGCINDLISILALPAIWNRHDPANVVSTLLDVLLRMLRLEFAYARLTDAMTGSPVEAVRVADRRSPAAQPQEVGRALTRWLTGAPSPSHFMVPNPVGAGEVSVVLFRLGLQGEVGILAAGSQRADFPTAIETLLLQVAVNQAAIGLQEARLLRDQRRAAEDLERRVAERTQQLTAANEELRKEIVERERAEEQRKQAEEALRQTQSELAHVSRVMTIGALTASIAHEVNQPLTGIVTNSSALIRWLAHDEPDLNEARSAAERMIKDANRASEVIQRVRELVKKTDLHRVRLDINDLIYEVVDLIQTEVRNHRVILNTELSAPLPLVLGDRVQLQQVLLNLLLNGIEAMDTVTDRPRELSISSRRSESDTVLVAVQDSGIGLDEQSVARLFDPFFTTKAEGMGMGLSISRSISEAHGGHLRASPNAGPGATFQLTLPTGGSHPS
jgi:C4-dicarboxylate-specific signal transduction histidine kinase